MVTTQAVIDKMNSLVGLVKEIEPQPEIEPEPKHDPEPQTVPVQQLAIEEETLVDVEQETVGAEATPEPESGATESHEQMESEVEQPQAVSCSERIARGVGMPNRYVLLTKIQQTTSKMDKIKEKSKLKAIQKEILQIFKELKAVEPV